MLLLLLSTVRWRRQTFAIVPCEGTISPGESVTVKAIFSPDYSRVWPFLAAFRIEARDQASMSSYFKNRHPPFPSLGSLT